MSSEHSEPLRIALVVDNPYRDLPGLVLVAWRLCQQGVSCYLVPMNIQFQEILSLAPHFVLMNYLRKNNQESVRNYLAAGIQVGVLDTEGGVFSPIPAKANSQLPALADGNEPSPWEAYSLTVAEDAEVRKRVACVCTWTPEFADYLGKRGIYRPDQIKVTGTPRIDFYAPSWRKAARLLAPTADEHPRPMILLNGSFPLANPRFQTPEREVEQLISEFHYEASFAREWQRTQSAAMHGLTSLSNLLARKFPEVSFVFRPHPFEGEKAYRELLEPLPNLSLVKRGTVDGWILGSEAMIHWGSSTALEGSLAGIPVFAPGWLPVHLPIPIVDAVSIRPPTPDSLIEQISAVLSGRFTLPDQVGSCVDHSIRSAFYRSDGDASQRVTEAVLSSLRSGARRMASEQWRGVTRAIDCSTPGWARTIGSWDASDKSFTTADVERIASAISAAAGDTGRPVCVAPALSGSDYQISNPVGRAVSIRPEGSLNVSHDQTERPSLAEKYLQRGESAYTSGDRESAHAWFVKAIEEDPDLGAAHQDLGVCYFEQDLKDSAIEHFERALTIDAGHFEARLNLAITLLDRPERASAIEHLIRAYQASPALFQDAVNAQLLSLRARVAESLMAFFASGRLFAYASAEVCAVGRLLGLAKRAALTKAGSEGLHRQTRGEVEFSRFIAASGTDRSGPLLEVGSGESGLSEELRSAGFERISRCAWDRPQMPLEGLRSYADRSADVVVSSDVLGRLENPTEMLREMERILTPDGRIFLSLPNAFNVFERLAIAETGNSTLHRKSATLAGDRISMLPTELLESICARARLEIDGAEGSYCYWKGHFWLADQTVGTRFSDLCLYRLRRSS